MPNKGGNYDDIYSKMISEDLTVIIDICRDTSATTVSEEQVGKAKSLNIGKAPDVYGVTAEHFLNGGEALDKYNQFHVSMFRFGKVHCVCVGGGGGGAGGGFSSSIWYRRAAGISVTVYSYFLQITKYIPIHISV